MTQVLLAVHPSVNLSHPQATAAHMAYRIGPGPKLLGVRLPPQLRGGVMLLEARDWDGSGDPIPCCRQILWECRHRGYSGIVCDFEGPPVGSFSRLVHILDRNCQAQGWSLDVPAPFASFAPGGRVLVSSVVTSGTLRRRLQEAVERYGAPRTTLAVEWVREDFPLPAQHRGTPISQQHLEGQMRRLEPAVFYDRGMCQHYYTYMAAGGQAHFVLYDTPQSVHAKVQLAREMHLGAVLLPGPEVEGCLEQILSK